MYYCHPVVNVYDLEQDTKSTTTIINNKIVLKNHFVCCSIKHTTKIKFRVYTLHVKYIFIFFKVIKHVRYNITKM